MTSTSVTVTFRDYERLAYYANVAYVVFTDNGASK